MLMGLDMSQCFLTDELIEIIKAFMVDMMAWEQYCANYCGPLVVGSKELELAELDCMSRYYDIIKQYGSADSNIRQSLSYSVPSRFDVSTMKFRVAEIGLDQADVEVLKSGPWEGTYLYRLVRKDGQWHLTTSWIISLSGEMIEGEL